MSLEERLHGSQRVVFQMLMANVVKSIPLEHRYEIILLHYPNSVGRQNSSYVLYETIGFL